MAENTPLPFFRNGMVREEAVDQALAPLDSLEFSLNMHGDKIGSYKLRKGVTLVGSQITASTPVLGIGNYRNNAGTNYKALAKVGTSVYAFDGVSWSSVRNALTAGSKARFTNFVDYTFMVNGNGNQACSTYNGSGSFGSTNVASLPAGDFIENYRSRIWIAVNSVDKLYYSDVVTTSNTITGGTEFIQISPADGEKITGLKRADRKLLVFKQNHIYRVYSINSVDPDPAINRGTYSQESIIEAKNGIYYHHPTGFYRFVDGGQQEEISRPIVDILQAIPRANYENIAGWADEDHLYWSIGDITLNGVSFSNVVCRRTISTETWTVYSYASEFRSSGLYDDGTNLKLIVGDDDGNVLQFDSGTTDNGSPIFYDLYTHWYYFSQIKSAKKTFSELISLHENAQGASISYQIDNDNKTPGNAWRPVGNLKRDISDQMSIAAKDFIRIRFRLSGNSVGSPLTFRGWELLGLIFEGQAKP